MTTTTGRTRRGWTGRDDQRVVVDGVRDVAGIPSNVLAEMAAHDLREPIHSIEGFVSILLTERAGTLTAMQRDFLTSMFRSARRLERLITDIQVLLAGADGFPLAVEPVDFEPLVRACIQELAGAAEDAGLHVTLARDERHLPGTLLADPVRLEQILLNVLENAIHYADPGSVVRVSIRRSTTRVLCVVENDSVRIADEDPTHWFRPYERGTAGAGRRSGRGLGLAVVDLLVHAHGGRLAARRRAGRVTIAVALPMAATQPVPPNSAVFPA